MRAHAATPRFDPAAVELPGEVRLLNITASMLFVVGGVLMAVLALMWLIRQPVFNIKSVKVEGEVTRNSVSTIRANALPQLAGNYFTLDLARGKQAFEAVPWVRQAIVQRVWPNRLRVLLEEHHAVALWAMKDGDDQLVNAQGEVFQANLGDVEDESLPTLKGPDGSSAEVLAMYHRLVPVFERLEMHIDQLSMSGRGSWHAEFDSGAEIELGRGTQDELVARSERFVATVTQVIERYQRPLVYADLRHNEGYAVRLKGITTTTVATPPGRRN
ncbi:cell division protein FtsQ/DivIB [Piscinibacter sp. HJYY11]|uniref:cell division protein FtsQ/DivIB n=1 Tax=Piscinibacter sp. HJYY11 TaxID=2801333 RepID=UPI00191D2124|nr:cell division protein FtsQ/DivIB [Piscinibacter sp. HJYY11]MBL0727954.1 cell division protein FtsQ/DivIB [Piscinibacter sp. HJYY11]